MEIVIGWFVFSVSVGIAANSRGRSFFGWTALSMVFSPLIGAFLLLVMPNMRTHSGAPTPATHVRCPDCRELVLRDARKCKHCGCVLVPQ